MRDDGSPSQVYLSADVARRMDAAGSTIRTPGAVRQAVDDGRLFPDMRSAGRPPVNVWSEMALLRDIEREVRRQNLLRSLGRLRGPKREVQGQLPLGEEPNR